MLERQKQLRDGSIDLVGRPREREPLDAVGVGVLRRGEAAAVEPELAQRVLDRLLDDAAVAALAGRRASRAGTRG